MKGNILLLVIGVTVCFAVINKLVVGALCGPISLFCAFGFIILGLTGIRKDIVLRRRAEWLVKRAFAKACLEEINMSIPTESVRIYLMAEQDEEIDAYGCLVSIDRGTAEGKVYVDKFDTSILVCIEIVACFRDYRFPQHYVEYPNRFLL